MSIDSVWFIFGFMPALVALVTLLRHVAPGLVVPALLLASVGFYALASPGTIWLLALLVAMNIGFGAAITRWPARASVLVTLGIIAHLTPLVLWKIWGQGQIPLGLSFVTFLHLSALLDLRNGAHRLDLKGQALYSMFFASVTAGPITRYKDLAPQIADLGARRVRLDDLLAASALFVFGLAKVGLMGRPVQQVVEQIGHAATEGATLTLIEAWFATWGSLIALYFLFSGYSDLAMALGLMVGLRLAVNFNSPLKARSAAEFYDRWHMSLTGFIRVFIFSPLVKRVRKLRFGSIETRAILGWVGATLVSMTVIGAWHGASMLFIIGGFAGGMAMVLVQLPVMLGKRGLGEIKPLAVVGRVLLLVMIAIFALLHQMQETTSFSTILGSLLAFDEIHATARMAEFLPEGWVSHIDQAGPMPHVGSSAKLAILQLLLASLVAFLAPNSMQIMGLIAAKTGPRWRISPGWGLIIGLLAGLTIAAAVGQQVSGFVYDGF